MHHPCQLPDPDEFLAYSNLTTQGLGEVQIVKAVEKDLCALVDWVLEFSKREPEHRSWQDTQDLRWKLSWKLADQLGRVMPLYLQMKTAGPEYHLPVELSLRDFRIFCHHIVLVMHRRYEDLGLTPDLIRHQIESWNMDLVYLASRLYGSPILRPPLPAPEGEGSE